MFDPELCQCTICEDKLKSAYPGQFVPCGCGESYVDQTKYYSRYGGSVASVESLILKDLKVLSGLGYEKEDVLCIISEMTETDILTQYILPRGDLGGCSFQDLVEDGRGHKVIEILEAMREGY
jgi:hypothetical protein